MFNSYCSATSSEPSGYAVTIRYGGLSKDPVRVTLNQGRKKRGEGVSEAVAARKT